MRSKLHPKRAFTLIEIMISIAIVAIISATATLSWLGLGQLRREADFRFALRNGKHQLVALEQVPFADLPPQVLRPDRDGWLQLGQRNLVEATLELSQLDSARGSLKALQVEAAAGRVRVDRGLAGAHVLVDYEWLLPDQDEAQLVGPGGSVPLWNRPAVKVMRVRAARGERLEPVAGWKLSPDGSSLLVPPALTGRAVVVDYLGTRVRNRARGTFLDERLRRLDSPSPLKLVEVLEDYGQLTGALSLTTLRVNR